jgi:hypothetical protein
MHALIKYNSTEVAVLIQWLAASAAGLTSFNNVVIVHSSLRNGFLSFSWGNMYKLAEQVCLPSSARMLLERCKM